MRIAIPEPSLPIISVAEHKSVHSLAKALYDSCTAEGFIYVCDHGIPQEVIDKAFGISAGYFDGELEDKVHLSVDIKNNTGYTAM
jgi:isopenicillin N synthase-like dioxygenase